LQHGRNLELMKIKLTDEATGAARATVEKPAGLGQQGSRTESVSA